LNLVRGGVNYDCRIDVASGKATLSIDGEMKEFLDGDGAAAARAVTEISGLKGPGRYQLRFANVDNELVLWVNDQPVTFDVPTTYQDEGDVNPQTGSGASDLTPIGIGSDGAALEITRLKVLRDVYYVADAAFYPADPRSGLDSADGIELPFDDPLVEGDDDPNDEGYLGDDQYLPLGDNSPQSMDSRLWRVDRSRDWPIPTSVSRRMLLGKALFIYWPHPWHGFVPNFARMGFIR
jgi:signal peptidase I